MAPPSLRVVVNHAGAARRPPTGHARAVAVLVGCVLLYVTVAWALRWM
jgi:hypothetical protein